MQGTTHYTHLEDGAFDQRVEKTGKRLGNRYEENGRGGARFVSRFERNQRYTTSYPRVV